MGDSALTPPGDPDVTAGAPGDQGSEADYLLCVDGERSWRATLPARGELEVGRAPDASLRLDDDLVSRRHAQILIVPEGLRIADLGSRHGTIVNGKRLGAPRLLASGDVITIGKTVLIVHRPTRMASGRALASVDALRSRLEEEVERALRYQRELCVAVVRSSGTFTEPLLTAALARRLRLMDCAACVTDSELVLLLPELGIDEATEIVQQVVTALASSAATLAAGLAGSPGDGIEAQVLLAAARRSAEHAAPGTITLVREDVRAIELGGAQVLIADPAMAQLYELARRLARSGLPILIRGETGVGKELAARALHQFSARRGPLVSINCAAIPEALAESELFGHEKGAFSGAIASKPGQLELASGGTIFLDEVGDLPLAVQAKLLRVLENQELARVGELRPRKVDLRVIAATNRDLEADIAAGTFRRDLFYRLAAGQLLLPPLRDRPRDLVVLARQLLADACTAAGRSLALSVAATQAILLHRWPGNVRELKHAMMYAAATVSESGTEVEDWHLPATVRETLRTANDAVTPVLQRASVRDQAAPALPAAESVPSTASPSSGRTLADEVRELERARMLEALRATGGVQNQAAALVGMPLRTFATKQKRYSITAAEWTRS